MIPLSIAGWGVREGAAVYLLTYVGIGMEDALALSILLGLVTLLVALPGGLAWLCYRREVSDPDHSGIPEYFAKES